MKILQGQIFGFLQCFFLVFLQQCMQDRETRLWHELCNTAPWEVLKRSRGQRWRTSFLRLLASLFLRITQKAQNEQRESFLELHVHMNTSMEIGDTVQWAAVVWMGIFLFLLFLLALFLITFSDNLSIILVCTYTAATLAFLSLPTLSVILPWLLLQSCHFAAALPTKYNPVFFPKLDCDSRLWKYL